MNGLCFGLDGGLGVPGGFGIAMGSWSNPLRTSESLWGSVPRVFGFIEADPGPAASVDEGRLPTDEELYAHLGLI